MEEKYQFYNPETDCNKAIPNTGGNYIFVLEKGGELPNIGINCLMSTINVNGQDYEIIYTGVSSNLYKRIVKTHFGNNAGKSTLRKSIGSLMGFKKISRDRKDNGKTKFSNSDEATLSEWMSKHLRVLYFENPNYEDDEDMLIKKYNPPLNIDKNHNAINLEYRKMLRLMRGGAL